MNLESVFLPCSRWVYFKIYISKDFADDLIISLGSLLTMLESKSVIKAWFFIRYEDPEYHLRFRFERGQQFNLDSVINDINSIIRIYLPDNIIWNTNISLYERELERYNPDNIVNSEYLFHVESKFVLKILMILNENISIPKGVVARLCRKKVKFCNFELQHPKKQILTYGKFSIKK